jgi:hypothetical protein
MRSQRAGELVADVARGGCRSTEPAAGRPEFDRIRRRPPLTCRPPPQGRVPSRSSATAAGFLTDVLPDYNLISLTALRASLSGSGEKYDVANPTVQRDSCRTYITC